jgi:FecR protein
MKPLMRRELLRTLGALGAAGITARISAALASGDLPPSLHKLDGTATINGRQARAGSQVALGDRIATGPQSQAVVVLKGDAFLMRSDTIIEVKGREGILSDLTVATGRVLSVFSKKPVAVKAATASIGIRGTGFYLEVDAASVYFCLCYGEADIDGAGMTTRRVKTTHHEEPLILREGGGVMRAEPGPFRNHSDAELIMLEALVGREPPFVKDGTYPAKKY